jgi:hypothetical protein
MTTAHDFGLSAESDWTDPDVIVALFEYKQALIFETAKESVRRQEMIPIDVVIGKIITELEITEEMYQTFSFAGMMLAYDRKVRSMTDEERAEMERQTEAFLEKIDEVLASEFGGLESFIEQVIEENDQRKTEIEMLDQIFNDITEED